MPVPLMMAKVAWYLLAMGAVWHQRASSNRATITGSCQLEELAAPTDGTGTEVADVHLAGDGKPETANRRRQTGDGKP